MEVFKLYIPAIISSLLFVLLAIIGIRETYSKPTKETPTTSEYKYNITIEEDYEEELNNNIELKSIKTFFIDNTNLENYLKENSIDSILNDFEEDKIYDDASMYKKEEDTNKIIKIIKCLNGNYIIGDEDLKYSNKICK